MQSNILKPYRIITVLSLVIAIDTMSISLAWPVFASLFTGEHSFAFCSNLSMPLRNILYGITIGISSLFMFLCAPILGDISDRIGRRKVLLLCLIGTSFGMGLTILGILWKHLILLIIGRAWLGAIAASQIIAKATIVDISTKTNKAILLGIVAAANNTGFIIGPIIGGLLTDSNLMSWFNFTTPFYFAAILALSNALILSITFKETNCLVQANSKWHFTNGIAVFARAFKDSKIRLLALIYICFQTGWALYLHTNFLTLVQKYHYSGKQFGYFSLWLGSVFCLNLLLLVRYITRIFDLKKIIYLAFFVATFCCIAVAYSNETELWLSLFPMVSAIALGGNAIVTTFSNTATASEQGWIMGVNNGLTALVWAITPTLAGLLLSFGFKIPLFIATFLFLGGAIITIVKIK